MTNKNAKPKLTTAKARSELAKINSTTAHAKLYKANAITHLLTYESSVASNDVIDLSALFSVYCHVSWLSDHVRLIHDKQVLPSQRAIFGRRYGFYF